MIDILVALNLTRFIVPWLMCLYSVLQVDQYRKWFMAFCQLRHFDFNGSYALGWNLYAYKFLKHAGRINYQMPINTL